MLASVNSGLRQASILGFLLFLIYINNFSESLLSNVILCAKDTYLFHVIDNVNVYPGERNKVLKTNQQLSFSRKMIFNPDANKQAQEVIFSRRINKPTHPQFGF